MARGSPDRDVDRWFAGYDNPHKDAMLRVRSIILEDGRITETIKWSAPTFTYRGNMASFNPRSKNFSVPARVAAGVLSSTGAGEPSPSAVGPRGQANETRTCVRC